MGVMGLNLLYLIYFTYSFTLNIGDIVPLPPFGVIESISVITGGNRDHV